MKSYPPSNRKKETVSDSKTGLWVRFRNGVPQVFPKERKRAVTMDWRPSWESWLNTTNRRPFRCPRGKEWTIQFFEECCKKLLSAVRCGSDHGLSHASCYSTGTPAWKKANELRNVVYEQKFSVSNEAKWILPSWCRCYLCCSPLQKL